MEIVNSKQIFSLCFPFKFSNVFATSPSLIYTSFPPNSTFIVVVVFLDRWKTVSVEMELSARIRKTWFYLINAQNFDQSVKATLSKICNLFRETVYIKKAIIWISGFSFLSFIRRNTSHFVLPNLLIIYMDIFLLRVVF